MTNRQQVNARPSIAPGGCSNEAIECGTCWRHFYIKCGRPVTSGIATEGDAVTDLSWVTSSAQKSMFWDYGYCWVTL